MGRTGWNEINIIIFSGGSSNFLTIDMKLDFISFNIPEDKKIEVMSLLTSSSNPLATQRLELKMEGSAEDIAREIIEAKEKVLKYIKNEL